MARRRIAWLVALGLVAGAVTAPRATRAEDEPAAKKGAPADLGPRLAPLLAKHDVPGMVAAVVTSEGVIARGVAGVRKRGDDVKATVNDLWHIGSCTKSMTATLIGRLVDQKKLRFEMTLPEAFPDLAKTMHPGWKKATLGMLLQNRGGMPEDLRKDGLWMALYAHTGSPREARRLLTRTVLSWPPVHEPGTAYEYSNAGFAIAGHAAESLLDTEYETLLRKEILVPLRAVPAGFGPPGAGAADVAQPWGHAFDGRGNPPVAPTLVAADNPPAITPAGRVHLTIDAWARYVQLHLRGARAGTDKLLLSRTTLQHMQTPPKGAQYAMGWVRFTRPWAGGPAFMHNGTNTMWYAVTWIAPKKDVAFLVVCNQGGGPGNAATDAAIWSLITWWRARTAKSKAGAEAKARGGR